MFQGKEKESFAVSAVHKVFVKTGSKKMTLIVKFSIGDWDSKESCVNANHANKDYYEKFNLDQFKASFCFQNKFIFW